MNDSETAYYRGDVIFVKDYRPVVGSEQRTVRPAVIISNDTGNSHSNTVACAWITTKQKKPIPTHTSIICRVPSIVLCEQIATIAKERIDEFIRTATEEEMQDIDKALKISLDLSGDTSNNAEIQKLSERLKEEEQCKEEAYAYIRELETATPGNVELTRIQTERDLYKQQYEQILERLIAK